MSQSVCVLLSRKVLMSGGDHHGHWCSVAVSTRLCQLDSVSGEGRHAPTATSNKQQQQHPPPPNPADQFRLSHSQVLIYILFDQRLTTENHQNYHVDLTHLRSSSPLVSCDSFAAVSNLRVTVVMSMMWVLFLKNRATKAVSPSVMKQQTSNRPSTNTQSVKAAIARNSHTVVSIIVMLLDLRSTNYERAIECYSLCGELHTKI